MQDHEQSMDAKGLGNGDDDAEGAEEQVEPDSGLPAPLVLVPSRGHPRRFYEF